MTLLLWFLLVQPGQKPKPTQGSPIAFAWICPNHATHIGHELDILEVVSGALVQTVLLATPTTEEPTGEVVGAFRLAPTVPGTYVAVVRAIGPAGPTPNSLPSASWVTSAGPWSQATP